MPVSAYIQSVAFFILAAVALFAAAGTVAILTYWVYLAIFAAVFVASFLWLDPDLARERMRPGGKKPPLALRLFSGVLFVHWIIAGLDHGRFHWSDTVPARLQWTALIALAAGYALLPVGHAREPLLLVDRAHPKRSRAGRHHHRALRHHPPPGLSRRHRDRGGEWSGARLLDRRGRARGLQLCRFSCIAPRPRTVCCSPNCRAIATTRSGCAGGCCREFGEGRQEPRAAAPSSGISIANSHKTYYGISRGTQASLSSLAFKNSAQVADKTALFAAAPAHSATENVIPS